MQEKFIHYSATGNTFLIFDDLSLKLDLNDKLSWEKVANQHNVDGLLFVQPSDHHFRMRYLNKDGAEVEMCGNGARAICTFVKDFLAIPLENNMYRFDTYNGPLRAKWNEQEFGIYMGEPRDLEMIDVSSFFEAEENLYVNTGVPHVVYKVDDVDALDLIKIAAPIRYDKTFTNGTNINFYQLNSKTNEVKMRTYERGVEGETLSCGTGTTAVAMALHRFHGFENYADIKAPGGLLRVSWSENFTDPILSGPVDEVKRGTLD